MFPARSAQDNRKKERDRERCHNANPLSWIFSSKSLVNWSRHLPISDLTPTFPKVGAQPGEKVFQKKFFCLTRVDRKGSEHLVRTKLEHLGFPDACVEYVKWRLRKFSVRPFRVKWNYTYDDHFNIVLSKLFATRLPNIRWASMSGVLHTLLLILQVILQIIHYYFYFMYKEMKFTKVKFTCPWPNSWLWQN